MSDERQGLISASGSPILYACAGSQRMQKGMPNTSTQESLQGDEIHAALEQGDFTGLDETGKTIAQKLQGMVDRFLQDWGEPDPLIFKEKRFWLLAPHGAALASAKPDLVAISRDQTKAAICDFKSGYIPVAHAAQNIQLRVQSLCVQAEFPTVAFITAATAQFRFTGRMTAVIYGPRELEVARAEFDLKLFAASEPEALLNAGEWCRWCTAKGICPSAMAWSLLPVAHVQKQGVAVTSKNAAELVKTLTTQQQATLRKSKAVIEKILEAVDDALRELPIEELNKVGLTIGKPARVVSVDNAAMAQQLLCIDNGLMSLEEFAGSVKVVMSRVEDVVVPQLADKMGISKQDAKAELFKLLAPASSEHFRTAPLRALKEKNE